MERLTERTTCGVANIAYPQTCYFKDGSKDKIALSAYRQLAIERLAAYEDTGLEPEEVRRLQKDWTALIMTLEEMGGIPHIRDIIRAEKGGRLVVLPCGTDAESDVIDDPEWKERMMQKFVGRR